MKINNKETHKSSKLKTLILIIILFTVIFLVARYITNEDFRSYINTKILKKEVSNFSYKVWNDLVYKVYEARLASGSSNWDTTYGSFNNTHFYTSTKFFTTGLWAEIGTSPVDS